jgi:PncC family amidohydrolase
VEDLLEIRIGVLLRERGLKLATAESCTGGLVGHRLTNIPGSSDYYLGGIIAYAYEAKVALLEVSWETLHRYGAVSRETVSEMARGARLALGADIAVSVSGIAGPGGGLPGKPVGTTWLGLSAADGEWARVFCFSAGREGNKSLSAQAALQFTFDYLKGVRELDVDARAKSPGSNPIQ